MSNGATPIIAAAAARKRREMIARFRRAGATSPSTARTLEELELRWSPLLAIQSAKGVLVQIDSGRYYLDEEAEARMAQFRRMILAAALAVAAITVLWLVLAAS